MVDVVFGFGYYFFIVLLGGKFDFFVDCLEVFGYDDEFVVGDVVLFEGFFNEDFRGVVVVYVGCVLGVEFVVVGCFEEGEGFFFVDCLVYGVGVVERYVVEDRD